MSSGKGPEGPKRLKGSGKSRSRGLLPGVLARSPAGFKMDAVFVRAEVMAIVGGADPEILRARELVSQAAIRRIEKTTGEESGKKSLAGKVITGTLTLSKEAAAAEIAFRAATSTSGEEADISATMQNPEIEEISLSANPLDIVIDGKTLRERFTILDNFWKNCLPPSHTAAQLRLVRLLPELGEGGSESDPFNPKNVIEDLRAINPIVFYSSTKPEGECTTVEAEAFNKLAENILNRWRREDRLFLKVPPFRHMTTPTITDLALRCPRTINCNFDISPGLGTVDLGDSDRMAAVALRRQAIFSHLSQHALSIKDTEKYEPLHREAYMLAQAATLAGDQSGYTIAQPGRKEGMFAPSLAFVDRFKDDKEKAKSFINARLALLLPTRKGAADQSLVTEERTEDGHYRVKFKDVVQEDFITLDLISFAKEVGVWEEYKDVFDALYYYRQRQFIVDDFHLASTTKDKDRMLLMDLLKLVTAENGGCQKPSLASFGCGQGLFEKLLMAHGDVDSVIAVDKHPGKRAKIERAGPKFKIIFVPERYQKKDSKAFMRTTLGCLSPANIVVAADSLHETDNPKAYFIEIFKEEVRPRDYLYVSDPVHCTAVEDLTSDVLNRFDGTPYLSSMISLEDYLDILAYLRAVGGEVVARTIVPFGYGDTFIRISLVIKKLPKEQIPYYIPQGPEINKQKPIVVDEDIFEVFPFNLISQDQRDTVLNFTGRGFATSLSRPILFSEVRAFVISRLLKFLPPVGASGIRRNTKDSVDWEVSRYKSFRSHPGVKKYLREKKCYPYPIDDLLRFSGDPEDELRTRNRIAADVIALRGLLRDVAQTDISGKLRELPSWELFV